MEVVLKKEDEMSKTGWGVMIGWFLLVIIIAAIIRKPNEGHNNPLKVKPVKVELFSPSTIRESEHGTVSFKNKTADNDACIVTLGNASFVPLNILGEADKSNAVARMVLGAVDFFEQENPNLEVVSFNVNAGPFVEDVTSKHTAYVWGVWIYHKPRAKIS